MYRGHETLVDIRSPTFAAVSKYLRDFKFCLYERSQSGDVLITTSSIDSVLRLSVAFPSYGLSFFMNEKEELESCDFKDMVYDEDQSIGALFCLQSFLVLRPKILIAGSSVPEAFIPRRVLIPNGFPVMTSYDQFMIDPRRGVGEPPYYTYDVDTELGCLVGSGSLDSTQYLADLYAYASCHRPDPLTGKTGAQAALCLLQSAGCRSIIKLADDFPCHFRSALSTPCPQVNHARYEIQQWSY